MTHFLEGFRFVNALPPAADAFAGVVFSAAVNIRMIGRLAFVYQRGAGSGTSTLLVCASRDSSPLNFVDVGGITDTAPIPYSYRRINADNTVEDIVKLSANGFTTTEGAYLYVIEIDAQALANLGFTYAALLSYEVTNSPVTGSILAMGADLRYGDDNSDIVS